MSVLWARAREREQAMISFIMQCNADVAQQWNVAPLPGYSRCAARKVVRAARGTTLDGDPFCAWGRCAANAARPGSERSPNDRADYFTLEFTSELSCTGSNGFSNQRLGTSSRKRRARGVKAPPVRNTTTAACSGANSHSAR